MKFQKGKLYSIKNCQDFSVLGHPNHMPAGIWMHTKYYRKEVFVKKGEILLYLSNKLNYFKDTLVPATKKPTACRMHKFLWKTDVLSWQEPSSYHVDPAYEHLLLENIFELIQIEDNNDGS